MLRHVLLYTALDGLCRYAHTLDPQSGIPATMNSDHRTCFLHLHLRTVIQAFILASIPLKLNQNYEVEPIGWYVIHLVSELIGRGCIEVSSWWSSFVRAMRTCFRAARPGFIDVDASFAACAVDRQVDFVE